ncbi:MAG: hypothetical protein ACKVP0_03370 [Pirellulaceae bacterium]
MRPLHPRTFLWLATLLASVCLGCGGSTRPLPPTLTDAQITERLVGKWQETGDAGGLVSNEFTKEGKYRSEGVEKRPHGETKFVITASWKVAGGMLTYTIESSKPAFFKPGETLEEKVLSIDGREFKYRDVNGKVQTMERQ